ncbi:hypothetical protein Pst134EA_029113, partial [Puccinia striiformis f. sp. tritici]
MVTGDVYKGTGTYSPDDKDSSIPGHTSITFPSDSPNRSLWLSAVDNGRSTQPSPTSKFSMNLPNSPHL